MRPKPKNPTMNPTEPSGEAGVAVIDPPADVAAQVTQALGLSTEPIDLQLLVPIADVPQQTWGLHVDTRLSPEQTNTLRAITQAFVQRRATLANGQQVRKPADALKLLLEAIATARNVPASSDQ
jgi:hypothetical protein